jgi:hypothetical protein
VAVAGRSLAREFWRRIRAFAAVIVDEVAGNPVHPRRQAVGVLQPAEVGVDPHEGLLEQVLGGVLVGDPAADEPPQILAK